MIAIGQFRLERCVHSACNRGAGMFWLVGLVPVFRELNVWKISFKNIFLDKRGGMFYTYQLRECSWMAFLYFSISSFFPFLATSPMNLACHYEGTTVHSRGQKNPPFEVCQDFAVASRQGAQQHFAYVHTSGRPCFFFFSKWWEVFVRKECDESRECSRIPRDTQNDSPPFCSPFGRECGEEAAWGGVLMNLEVIGCCSLHGFRCDSWASRISQQHQCETSGNDADRNNIYVITKAVDMHTHYNIQETFFFLFFRPLLGPSSGKAALSRHLFYIFLELVKNAARASIERLGSVGRLGGSVTDRIMLYVEPMMYMFSYRNLIDSSLLFKRRPSDHLKLKVLLSWLWGATEKSKPPKGHIDRWPSQKAIAEWPSNQ